MADNNKLSTSYNVAHYNFTECPVVFFSAIIKELPLISLSIGISSLNKFNNDDNNSNNNNNSVLPFSWNLCTDMPVL